MIFVKVDDLKPGMRLGKPIYNKNGVLLHERDSKLTVQSIYGVKNFGLIGLYILEPAEPVPPMTEDDIQFERFQTVSVFSIRDDLKLIASGKEPKTLDWLVSIIIKNYGRLDHKINFIQNLRSSDDFVFKHALNVAILGAMIGKQMGIPESLQHRIVKAALLHDVGRLMFPQGSIDNTSELSSEQKVAVRRNTNEALQRIDLDVDIKRLAIKLLDNVVDDEDDKVRATDDDIAVNILFVAYTYDRLTAMKSHTEPTSEIMAIRELMNHDRKFNSKVVNALITSINILNPGVCIELTDGSKGLVILENPESIMRPTVLAFDDNVVLDLSNDRIYSEVQIKDVMKTMDNRIKIDLELLNQQI